MARLCMSSWGLAVGIPGAKSDGLDPLRDPTYSQERCTSLKTLYKDVDVIDVALRWVGLVNGTSESENRAP
jgi:hypothetical protein